ncbi:alpha/beta hydrolase fold domain-containing protein [Nocardioides sp. MAHUQ-72]|uniref:alpha/beta hydrolase fold domain-containing protein n=1 Tax=unclassified Nocardioides TaxID=2615069 RepID=UPI0036125E79
MRIDDRLRAAFVHATARWTVRYGENLRFSGSDLPPPLHHRVPTRYGDVPVQVYRDPDLPPSLLPAYVHFHGGAFLMRYPEMDDFWCRYIAAEAGVVVVNVDFRAGPYVAYPVAQHECHDVTAWLADHGHRIGVDGRRIAVGGLSSGGGLAASVCLQARDRGSFRPALQVLGVPALDVASEPQAGTGTVSPGLRRLVRRVYFPDEATRREPYASPLLARDLTGLPPAVVLTAEHDALRPQGDLFAQRLREADVPVVHATTPAADHYFLTDDLLGAAATMALVADRVRRHTSDPVG